MSTYKHLADLLKICSVLPALAIMPAMADTAQYTNPAEVENWSNNKYTATDSKRTGGVLKVAKGDTVDEINAGEVKDNSITLTKTDGYNGEVFGQGSVLYNNGTIGKITGTFENNSITNTSATASKATANGGAFALYAVYRPILLEILSRRNIRVVAQPVMLMGIKFPPVVAQCIFRARLATAV